MSRQSIDLSQIPRHRNPRGRAFLGNLKAGDSVGIHAALLDCYVMSNGRVVTIDGDQVIAEFLRIDTRPQRLLQDLNTGHTLNQGRRLRKGALKRGEHVHVIEQYPGGMECMVSGQITALIADAFKVGGFWFDYGGTDADGRKRKLTWIGNGH